ncbi:FAD-dependent monooxygenase [Stenotrophomonas sp. 24(2023)]|uniref:FAD-dependent monooxygenase n=1 Tax=Stenotrophomonas sp. 24(2023) TaxID=3068324 RepID=UPI0027E0F225|nr:FAD-dependent monooxygenase [Stenotrophomonas sp. 24(2023)]WMJ68923.1 FAD-dependent monooxygenase [Stenotrophomonas sp. 24(2023)]
MTDALLKTPVLIVGGGLVGLSAGLFLQHHGIDFILIEQHAGVSPLPRARGIHLRTMELFRQIGLDAAIGDVAATAWRQGGFGGARRGRSLVEAQPLIDVSAMQKKLAAAGDSPSQFVACPQTLIEPVLRTHLQARGGDVRFGHRLLGFRQDARGVQATVQGPAGEPQAIAAAWMIGADGGGSTVRQQLGIGRDETAGPDHLVNIFFAADLAGAVAGRTFSQCEVANDRVQGLFLAMNNTDRWSFHLKYDPAQGPPPAEALPALLRAALGIEDIALEVISHGTWHTGVAIAQRYQQGRVLLCGDAAHLMPPWGGFNATTGIADAHNLAWKLAAILQGHAGPDLLHSYTRERRPLAVRNGQQALLRTDFDARFGIPTAGNREVFAGLIDAGALSLRYRYPAAGDGAADAALEPVAALHAQCGTRFPHAWLLCGGTRVSTLDLLGRGYVQLAGPAARLPHRAQASLDPAMPATWVLGRDVQFADAGYSWRTLTWLPDDGGVLVRPDGFVAARSDAAVASV